MTDVLDTGGPDAASVPVAEYAAATSQFLPDLLDACRRTRSVRADLGIVDPASGFTTELLSSVAACRREHLYGFELSCRVRAGTRDWGPGILRAAGVRTVELIEPSEEDDDEVANLGAERALLARASLVAALQHEAIDVTWRVPVGDADDEELQAVAHLCSWLHHLPPPVGMAPSDLDVAPGSALGEALASWRLHHRAHALSYARGPGFVRIFDRRTPAETVSFITLGGPQAEVFLAAQTASTSDELGLVVEDVPVEQLDSFLDKLVARRLMCRTTEGFYQSLPTRRRMEERWVAGEF